MAKKMKYNPKDFTIEICPWCGKEQVIYAKGITRCLCGKPLVPCSMCESCNYKFCDYGCNGTDSDAEKQVDHEALPEEDQKFYMKNYKRSSPCGCFSSLFSFILIASKKNGGRVFL